MCFVLNTKVFGEKKLADVVGEVWNTGNLHLKINQF